MDNNENQLEMQAELESTSITESSVIKSTHDVPFEEPEVKSNEREPTIILDNKGDYIAVAERDSEGSHAGIFYFNRQQISYAVFSAVQGTFTIKISSSITQIRPINMRLLNKQGQETSSFTTGVASNTEDVEFTFHDRENIVILHNFLLGTSDTVETYIGFKLYDKMMVKIQEHKKRQAAAEAKVKEEFEAENRSREIMGKKPFKTLEEYAEARRKKQTVIETNESEGPETERPSGS